MPGTTHSQPTNVTKVLEAYWKNNLETEHLNYIDWNALEEYAVNLKRKRTGHEGRLTCKLSSEFRKGGVHIVRLLNFDDGTKWLARLQMNEATVESSRRLEHEVNTIELIRQRSRIPVPEVFAYETGHDNAIGVAFMVMEFVSAGTALDIFGMCDEISPQIEKKFYDQVATIQVELTSIRLPRIGSIIKLSDGTYSVGPIPDIGGPFDSAADFFIAWASQMSFPYNERTIRERTPPEVVDVALQSIRTFPSRLLDFAQHHRFQDGPFPIIHTDLYNSNILLDSEYNVKSVIDWDNAIVAPWEVVEFPKALCIVPPVLNGPLHREGEFDRRKLIQQVDYKNVVRKTEIDRHFDNNLSATLDCKMRNLAHALWLYQDGRIGLYTGILDLFK